MILSLELCDNISWKFTQRVFKTYIERLKESYNKTVTDILQKNLPSEIIKVAECCSDSIVSSQRIAFISNKGATQVVDYDVMALPQLKPIRLSGNDFKRLMKAVNRSSDLSISMSRVQADTISILTELKVTDEILKYLPEIKEELDEVEKKYRGECFKAKIKSFVEEIRETLNKTKEREQQYDVK